MNVQDKHYAILAHLRNSRVPRARVLAHLHLPLIDETTTCTALLDSPKPELGYGKAPASYPPSFILSSGHLDSFSARLSLRAGSGTDEQPVEHSL
jgi:hypothetical protein